LVHSHIINGLTARTGDLICTTDGDSRDITGHFWRLLGKLIPGEVDHIIVYVGPGGRCVEAGAKGKVIEFETVGDQWDFKAMIDQRGVRDHLIGIAYPTRGVDRSDSEIARIRESVAAYCLEQAKRMKPYNMNFLDPKTERAFYCSQLAYLSYLKHGIDLNTGKGVPDLLFSNRIVFPQEIWEGCHHQRVDSRAPSPTVGKSYA